MRHYVMSSVFVILAGSAAADTDTGIHYNSRTLGDYGYVQDVNLGYVEGDADCELNQMSCVPTSWTNSLVYLQNKYGIDLAGLEIAGSDYNAWADTVVTLRSPDFMNTSPVGVGTTAYGQVHGIEQFLIHQGAGPLATSYQAMAASFMLPASEDNLPLTYPVWVMRGAPTLDLLNQWLEADAAVVIAVLYASNDDGTITEDGHALALVGIEWTDYNGNGIVDKWALDGITAEAFLLVIDPVDPTRGAYTPDGWRPIGPAKPTLIHVWQEPNPELHEHIFGMLNFSYPQYKGDCGTPYDSTNYGDTPGWLSGAGALNIIGGPGGSCCLVTGCDVLTETKCGELGGSWALSGSCDDCPEYCEGDTNHDGYVNMDDLLSMLGNWGACP
jgi:hypothetical protein